MRTLRISPWTDLPATPTSFIGRDAEFARIVRSCATRPLITLTGPGGIGKTRLAIEAARTVAVGRRAGAALAELAPVTAEAVAGTVLRTLGPAVRSRLATCSRSWSRR